MTKAEVKALFGKNYLGLEEQKPFFEKLGIDINSINGVKVKIKWKE